MTALFTLPRAKRLNPRRHPIRGIMLHWSGGNQGAEGLARYVDARAGGWYHYIVDERGAWEYADAARWRGAHALPAPWNDRWIGVCIAHPIIVSPAGDRAVAARGLQVDRARWPGVTSQVYTLDPGVAETTRELVATLCRVHGIPPVWWQGGRQDEGEAPAGVRGHCHVAGTTKWDPAPWWAGLSG